MNQRDQEIEKTILRKIETGDIKPFTDFFKGHLYNRFEEINQNKLIHNTDYQQASKKYSECYHQALNLVPKDKERLFLDMDSSIGTMEAEVQEEFYKQGFSDGMELKNYISAPGPSYSEPSPEPVGIDWVDSINIPEELTAKYDSVDVFYMPSLEKHPKLTILYKNDNALFIGFTKDVTVEEIRERLQEID